MKLETAKNRSNGCDVVAVILYLGTTYSVRKLKQFMAQSSISDEISPLDIADWYNKEFGGNSVDFLRVWQDNFKPIE